MEGVRGALYSYSIPLNFEGSVNRWSIIISIPVPEINSTANRMAVTVMIISLFILIFTVFFIILIARSLTIPLQKAVSFAEAISNGNLEVTMDLKRSDELGDLAAALNSMRKSLLDILSSISLSTEKFRSGSSTLKSSAGKIAEGANHQAVSVEEISANMEELLSNIMQNTENSSHSNKLASEASLSGEQGGNAVLKTVDAMNTIAEKIVVIEEIQICLL